MVVRKLMVVEVTWREVQAKRSTNKNFLELYLEVGEGDREGCCLSNLPDIMIKQTINFRTALVLYISLKIMIKNPMISSKLSKSLSLKGFGEFEQLSPLHSPHAGVHGHYRIVTTP